MGKLSEMIAKSMASKKDDASENDEDMDSASTAKTEAAAEIMAAIKDDDVEAFQTALTAFVGAC